MQSNADSWIEEQKGPHTILPFLFSDIGYEVWTCNNRGVFDYASHLLLNPTEDYDYWDYNWHVMNEEDLSMMMHMAYNHQWAPEGVTMKKQVTYVGLQSAAWMMLDALAEYEDYILNILGKAIFLAPTTWMDLPGPSFADPIMQQIRNLRPPFVGGEDWPKRRAEICDQAENAELCAHPFMAEDLKFPLATREWEHIQQQAEAKRF